MVDTGLNREGLSVWEISEATNLVLQKWPSWSLDGFYTHWCCVFEAQLNWTYQIKGEVL